jgi:hypothetical protein
MYCIDAPQRKVKKSLYRTAPPFWSPVLQRVDGAGFSKEGGRGLDVIVAVHHGDHALRDHLREDADSYSWECGSMRFQKWAVR